MQRFSAIYHKFSGHDLLKVLFLIIGVSFNTHATTQPAPSIDKNEPGFNAKQANKTFDQINLQLSVQGINIDRLETAINTLGGLINDANIYITFNQKKLNSIENLIKDAEDPKDKDGPQPKVDTQNKENTKIGADLLYLKQEQKTIADNIAQCRLFVIRAQEAIDTYQLNLSKIKKKQSLTRGMPLWSLWSHIQQDPAQIDIALPNDIQTPVFSASLFYKLSGTILLCITVSTLLIRRMTIHPFTKYVLRMKHIGSKDGILLFLCLLETVLSLYFFNNLPAQPNPTTAMIADLVLLGCVYIWVLGIINVLFKIKMIAAMFFWYSLDYHFFKNLLVFLLTYYTISVASESLIQTITISNNFWELIQIVFLLIVGMTAIGLFYYFCQTHRHIAFIRDHRNTLQWIIFLIFFGCGIPNILGYHQLGMQLTYGSITTSAILFSMFLVFHGINQLYLLCAYPSPLHNKLLQIFGYRANQTIVEFVMLRIILQVLVIFVGIYCIGQSWGFGAYYINKSYSQLLNGIPIASITIYPTRILAGLLAFCFLYLFFRNIATKLSGHSQFKEEGEERQVAIASLFIYIGFSCAFVTALLISGFDFTGLAIVAGALSVGIGLGLQSIVNNFVSGIIILLEKIIKPGDRISLDGLEGVVKKIRIRSTQITTAAREDVIIPNSDLITHAVTNYMFTDQNLSISCEVGVTYDNDPEFVKKILLQAAHEHIEVMKNARSKPNVLFQKFGDSAMVFELWFLIKDGNKKASVRSDINFTIDRLFREHKIKIAHPQRDINVKLSEFTTKNKDKS